LERDEHEEETDDYEKPDAALEKACGEFMNAARKELASPTE
jgi:hypothetical protein